MAVWWDSAAYILLLGSAGYDWRGGNIWEVGGCWWLDSLADSDTARWTRCLESGRNWNGYWTRWATCQKHHYSKRSFGHLQWQLPVLLFPLKGMCRKLTAFTICFSESFTLLAVIHSKISMLPNTIHTLSIRIPFDIKFKTIDLDLSVTKPVFLKSSNINNLRIECLVRGMESDPSDWAWVMWCLQRCCPKVANLTVRFVFIGYMLNAHGI